MTRYLLSTAMLGLMAGVGLGADIESGIEPGKSVSAFNPLNVTGPAAGEQVLLCLTEREQPSCGDLRPRTDSRLDQFGQED